MACLRWEFGFVCPFCLRHEGDLVGGLSVSKLRQISVEHCISQKEGKTLHGYSADLYDNCVYACMQCNNNRLSKPRRSATTGGELLNPRRTAWSDHFHAVADELRANAGDIDAAWTSDAYQINRPTKVAGRRIRRETVTTAFDKLAEISREKAELAREVARSAGETRRNLLRLIDRCEEVARQAFGRLSAFILTPLDAPDRCACGGARHLPTWIEQQGVPVTFPDAVIEEQRRRCEAVS